MGQQEARRIDTIDTEEMMKVYKRFGTPGPQHEKLKVLEGSWVTKTRAWMSPDQPPSEGIGTCEQKMLLGGHYLQQEYSGEMDGESFTGINIVGYDNFTGKYVSTWMDSMSTGIYYFEGRGSKDGDTITQESSYEDPVRGPMVWRSITKITDKDRIDYEMYLTPRGGIEEKAVEMMMTRKRPKNC